MSTLLVTGFPGFLGRELLPRLLGRRPEAHAVCLVQEKFAAAAREAAAVVERNHPQAAGRVRLVAGDITTAGLGAGDALEKGEVVEIHHLAAIYDLGVSAELGQLVNVEGTRHVLELAEQCPRLERLHYMSTCYVSGRHPGVFGEDDLEKGQAFNNHYEETKHRAEVEVRSRMRGGLPATIYRPAITVGDAATGVTQKYDGPYFAIQWLVRQPGPLAVMPVVGDLTAEVNVVPRDFVVDAIAHLSGLPRSRGRTYQLADPAPLSVRALLELLGRALGKRLLRVPLTVGLAKWSIERVPGVYRLLRIPSPMVDYFVQPTHYDTRNAQADLAGAGIACPPLASYVDRLVAFVRQNPGVGAAPMA
ncbi:MAG TPA: SDR family oxidoreductase [Anaeromyxobacter sp.]|nr:SDR family oxidoreductase [Anaeromyxobacter sp.]